MSDKKDDKPPEEKEEGEGEEEEEGEDDIIEYPIIDDSEEKLEAKPSEGHMDIPKDLRDQFKEVEEKAAKSEDEGKAKEEPLKEEKPKDEPPGEVAGQGVGGAEGDKGVDNSKDTASTKTILSSDSQAQFTEEAVDDAAAQEQLDLPESVDKNLSQAMMEDNEGLTNIPTQQGQAAETKAEGDGRVETQPEGVDPDDISIIEEMTENDPQVGPSQITQTNETNAVKVVHDSTDLPKDTPDAVGVGKDAVEEPKSEGAPVWDNKQTQLSGDMFSSEDYHPQPWILEKNPPFHFRHEKEPTALTAAEALSQLSREELEMMCRVFMRSQPPSSGDEPAPTASDAWILEPVVPYTFRQLDGEKAKSEEPVFDELTGEILSGEPGCSVARGSKGEEDEVMNNNDGNCTTPCGQECGEDNDKDKVVCPRDLDCDLQLDQLYDISVDVVKDTSHCMYYILEECTSWMNQETFNEWQRMINALHDRIACMVDANSTKIAAVWAAIVEQVRQRGLSEEGNNNATPPDETGVANVLEEEGGQGQSENGEFVTVEDESQIGSEEQPAPAEVPQSQDQTVDPNPGEVGTSKSVPLKLNVSSQDIKIELVDVDKEKVGEKSPDPQARK